MATIEKAEKAEKKVEQLQREAAQTELQRIPYNKLVVRPEDFGFRDEDELLTKGDSLKLGSLADDIAASGGIRTPLLVKRQDDGTYLVLDGHRRYYATRILIDKGVEGFSEDMLVPANVIVSDVSELEMVRSAAAANINRQDLSPLGRIRLAVRLNKLGMDAEHIALDLHVGKTTIERDLAVGDDEDMMDHVKAKNITATNAATLMKAATDADRVEEFKEAFDAWLEKVENAIQEKEDWLEANDKDPLPKAQTWPQKYLSPEQVKTWKVALEKKKPLVEASFKFKALISGKPGQQKLEISSLSKDLADLSAADLTKVYRRVKALSLQLPRLLEEKRAEGPGVSQEIWDKLAEEELRKEGFGDLLVVTDDDEDDGTDGEPDPTADATGTREEQDFADTAELPEDEEQDA